jgi:hypothetical protein
MLNIESVRELCRRASIATDPHKLAVIKDALRLMLQSEAIQLCRVQRASESKPN